MQMETDQGRIEGFVSKINVAMAKDLVTSQKHQLRSIYLNFSRGKDIV